MKIKFCLTLIAAALLLTFSTFANARKVKAKRPSQTKSKFSIFLFFQ